LLKILDKVNKNGCIIFTGDMYARIGDNKFTNIVSTNSETTLNNNGNKLIDFCAFNTFKIKNKFLGIKKSINLPWKLESTNQLLIIL
jgi:hypothetical protein